MVFFGLIKMSVYTVWALSHAYGVKVIFKDILQIVEIGLELGK